MVFMFLPVINLPSNGVFFDFDKKSLPLHTQGVFGSNIMRSAGADLLILPLSRPNSLAGLQVKAARNFIKFSCLSATSDRPAARRVSRPIAPDAAWA